jgi:hypothetical protein
MVTTYRVSFLNSEASGISILNNLTSPGPRGSVGTVAHEEIMSKINAPIRIPIKIDFIPKYLP